MPVQKHKGGFWAKGINKFQRIFYKIQKAKEVKKKFQPFF